MEFTVSTKLDMVNAIQRLKQGDIPSYVIKHRLGTTYYTVDFEQYEKGSSDFYHKTSSSDPIANPYYIAPVQEENNEQLVENTVTEEPVLEQRESVSEIKEDTITSNVLESNLSDSVLNLNEHQDANKVEESEVPVEEDQNPESVAEQDEWSKWVLLQQSCETLKERNEQLEQENANLKETNKKLNHDIDTLIQEKGELLQELDTLKDTLKNQKEDECPPTEDLCDYDLEDIIDEIITRGFSIELKRTPGC